MSFTITCPEGIADLHCHYQGQSEPQRVYVQLDGTNLSMAYDGEIGNAVPMAVHHGTTLRWTLPRNVVPTARAAGELLDMVAPLAERVAAGLTEEWNGSNHVGRLDDDATEAGEQIDRLITEWSGALDSAESVYEVDAAEWYQDAPPAVTADATDADLERIAETMREEMEPNQLLTGEIRYLDRLREKAQS